MLPDDVFTLLYAYLSRADTFDMSQTQYERCYKAMNCLASPSEVREAGSHDELRESHLPHITGRIVGLLSDIRNMHVILYIMHGSGMWRRVVW